MLLKKEKQNKKTPMKPLRQSLIGTAAGPENLGFCAVVVILLRKSPLCLVLLL
jgi:hypothetical protein